MNDLFYRPINFQDNLKEKEIYKEALELKNKALKEIDLIDKNKYTEESLNRRDELVEIVKNCINIMKKIM